MLSFVAGLVFAAGPAPYLAVVMTDDAGQAQVAKAAVEAIATTLDARPVSLAPYLKAMGPDCRTDLGCLGAAPELSGTPRFLVLELRRLSGELLAVDLRLVERETTSLLGRSAAAVGRPALVAWVRTAAERLVRASAAGEPRSAFPASPAPGAGTGVAASPPKAEPPVRAPSSPASPPPAPEEAFRGMPSSLSVSNGDK